MQTTIGAGVMRDVGVGVSSGALWTGRVIAGVVTAFMLLDAAMKFAKPAQVAAAFVRSGWPLELSVTLGWILLTSTVLYVIPRTAILGAILLTGYLGGAVASTGESAVQLHAVSGVFRSARVAGVVAARSTVEGDDSVAPGT